MAVLRLGDWDGDGAEDFAVGASGQPDVSTSIPGYFRLFSGATRAELATFHGKNPGEFFGWWLAAGDFDGDSVTDFAASARTAEDGVRRNTGRVNAYSGADGSQLYENFGVSVGDKIGRLDARGDFDLDGRADLLLGAGLASVGGQNDVGIVYLLPGGGCLAAWSNYGSGLSGTLGVPRLESSADPSLGATNSIDVGNSLGAKTFGVLLIGLDDASMPSGRGGEILVDASVYLPLCFPSGSDLSIPADVPIDTTLCGLHFYLQAIELDPGASHGLSFSRGLELTLGGLPW